MDYQIIRSNRKTLAVQITKNGEVIVRAPFLVSRQSLERFLDEKKEWIEKHQESARKAEENRITITPRQREEGIERAKRIFPRRISYYAERMKVTYGKVTLREQKTRWGSCSSKGNLNFNWKLVLLPERLLDYVVVHELAHRIEMNHSPEFWKIVEKELPDYRERRKELKMCRV